MLLLPSDRVNDVPLEDQAPQDILRLAETAYEALLATGLSRSEARQRLLNTEPFNLYPSLVSAFGATTK